jgi:hypothetical protein
MNRLGKSRVEGKQLQGINQTVSCRLMSTWGWLADKAFLSLSQEQVGKEMTFGAGDLPNRRWNSLFKQHLDESGELLSVGVVAEAPGSYQTAGDGTILQGTPFHTAYFHMDFHSLTSRELPSTT